MGPQEFSCFLVGLENVSTKVSLEAKSRDARQITRIPRTYLGLWLGLNPGIVVINPVLGLECISDPLRLAHP